MSKNSNQPLINAGEIIEAFGGIRPMAAKIDTPVTTVQGWKKRDVIPATRREQIIKAANDHNIDIAKLIAAKAEQKSEPKKQPEKTEIRAEKPKSVPVTAMGQPPKAEVKQTVQTPDKKNHDDLMAAIESQSQKTVVTSTWIAVGLILITAVAGAFLLWPQAKETVEIQNEKIAALEEEVDSAAERPGFMGRIIPEDMQMEMRDRADRLQNQVKNVQNTVEQLSEKAEAISNGMLSADAGPLSQRLQVLEEQIGAMQGGENFAALISRIQSLEESMTGQEQLSQSMEELKNMMITREQVGGTIDDGLSMAQEKSGALGDTLEGVSGNDLKAAAMLITFSQIRNAFYRQAPFEKDLAVLQRLAGEDDVELQAAIARLAPHADGGVLSSEGLSREFKGLAGDIVMSSLQGEDVSLKEKAQARLSTLLKVEKEGELLTGTQTQNKVATAQKMLDEGNIQGAIVELQSLDGQAAVAAQPFIEQAKASLLAGDLQRLLGDTILSKVSGQLPLSSMVDVEGIAPDVAIPDIKRALEDVPLTTNEVIKDEESGVSILPRDQKFKGFSGGQRF